MSNLDSVEYFIWGMKESDYIVKTIGTGGALVIGGCKEALRKCTDGNKLHSKKFTYTKPFHWHFHYQHIISDHNNLHHSLPSLEDNWRTDWQPAIIFTFLLLVSEVHFYL